MASDGAIENRIYRAAFILMTLAACADCKSPLDPTALSCPSCHALTHATELETLAAQARGATMRQDLAGARDFWQRAAALLPPDTVQYRSVQARITQINHELATAPQPGTSASGAKWGKGAAGIGPALLVLLSKGKLLLLGLTKLSTILSMIAFAGVYWALYGWAFAIGIVISIYIHEMGHVIQLRQYGIVADAPMFIPGLGAFIRVRMHMPPVQDSRVGLAGPIYGLGAAVVALAVAYFTGNKAWAAIAHVGAVINLFNLIPIWQLDGSRGFASLVRQQRLLVLSAAVVLWLATSEPMLFLIALVCVYRLFTKDTPAEPDQIGLTQFFGLLAALSAVSVAAQHLTK